MYIRLHHLLNFLPYIHTQPKLVGLTSKKLVQMVPCYTSVIQVMLARLGKWTREKLVMTTGLGMHKLVMSD